MMEYKFLESIQPGEKHKRNMNIRSTPPKNREEKVGETQYFYLANCLKEVVLCFGMIVSSNKTISVLPFTTQ